MGVVRAGLLTPPIGRGFLNKNERWGGNKWRTDEKGTAVGDSKGEKICPENPVDHSCQYAYWNPKTEQWEDASADQQTYTQAKLAALKSVGDRPILEAAALAYGLGALTGAAIALGPEAYSVAHQAAANSPGAVSFGTEFTQGLTPGAPMPRTPAGMLGRVVQQLIRMTGGH